MHILSKKTSLKTSLNPGLNLTIFRGTGPWSKILLILLDPLLRELIFYFKIMLIWEHFTASLWKFMEVRLKNIPRQLLTGRTKRLERALEAVDFRKSLIDSFNSVP